MRHFTPLISFCLVLLLVFSSCGKDDIITCDGPIYKLSKLDFNTQLPHQVNLLFQIQDEEGKGVPNLTTADLILKEDGDELGLEAQFTLEENDVYLTLRTVLLLDVSVSVEANLDDIKQAAITLINNKADYQQVAVYTFSSNPEMIQDFTTNTTDLISAINSIEVGTSSTNLYGAIVETADLWPEEYSITQIYTGNLIVLTDGDDTQDSVPFEEAMAAVSGKDVYMLGLGSDLDVGIMQQLGDYYSALDITQLENVFLEIQAEIERSAQSIYWVHFQSPKRGNKDHTITLTVRNNCNPFSDASVSDTFNSKDFHD